MKITKRIVLVSTLLMLAWAKTEHFCQTKTCIIESARLLEQIDQGIDPCKDFYQFACGGYLKNAHGDVSLRPSEILFAQEKRQILELYSKPISKSDLASVKFVKDIFNACVTRRGNNLRTLKNHLQEIGGWPLIEGPRWNEDKFDWLQTIYKFRELGYNFSVFFDLIITSNPRNRTESIFQITIPQVGTENISQQKDLIKKVGLKLKFGIGLKQNEYEIQEMEEFEEKLRKKINSVNSSTTILPIGEFQKRYAIDWLEFINSLTGNSSQLSNDDYVIFPQMGDVAERLDVILNTSKRTVANYMIWKIVEPVLPYLSTEFDLNISEQIPRSEFCLTEIEKKLHLSPIKVLYARTYLNASKRRKIRILAESIKKELLHVLNDASYIRNSDKKYTQDKLAALNILVGAPEHFFRDKNLKELDMDFNPVEGQSFLSLLMQLNKNYQRQIYREVNNLNPQIEKKWKSLNIFQGIEYFSKENLLNIPTNSIQKWIFDEERPYFLNYAGLGKLIGNAMKGFLTGEANKYDINGKKAEGWSDESTVRYKNVTHCLRKSLKSTILAYTMGTKLPYDAYKKWRENNKIEQKLIGLDYNTKQLFWISSQFCAPTNPYSTLENDIYNYAGNEPLRNNPDFAGDFHCRIGTPMNPVKKCSIF